jgi:hypothetical protein
MAQARPGNKNGTRDYQRSIGRRALSGGELDEGIQLEEQDGSSGHRDGRNLVHCSGCHTTRSHNNQDRGSRDEFDRVAGEGTSQDVPDHPDTRSVQSATIPCRGVEHARHLADKQHGQADARSDH